MPGEVDEKWVQFQDCIFNNFDWLEFFVTHAGEHVLFSKALLNYNLTTYNAFNPWLLSIVEA